MSPDLHCPTCGRATDWSEVFPFRPFCSERCRLIDLGAWLSEEHRIPGEAADPATRGAAEAQGGEAPNTDP